MHETKILNNSGLFLVQEFKDQNVCFIISTHPTAEQKSFPENFSNMKLDGLRHNLEILMTVIIHSKTFIESLFSLTRCIKFEKLDSVTKLEVVADIPTLF